MVASMARRGPGAGGVARWSSAVLGRSRLAVLDPGPAGNQPMVSEDGSCGVVFNGCIYNFQELRRELEARGRPFRSNSDTEALLRGYMEWGAEALVARLRGMFAFGVWDDRERKLTLARDRLGVKPLIYAEAGNRLAFASTVAALRRAGFTGGVDPQAVLEFLEFGYVTEDRTIYQGARKLPAGAILEWRNGKLTQQAYWTAPEPDESRAITFDEAVDRTEELLIEAVRLRLYADVPLGVLLSGGVDSALVCWALKRLNASVTAFTVATPGEAGDESGDAERTARLLGVPHRVMTLPAEEPELMDELVDAYAEPFGCSSALGMLRLARAIKPVATVLLTGDGGDDVFLGYPFHKHFWMAQRLARLLPEVAPGAWRLLRPCLAGGGALRRARHFLDYATGGLGAVTRIHDGLPYYERRSMLGERLAGMGVPQRSIPLSLASARTLLPDVLRYEQRMRFAGEFMPKVDGASMYHAMEVRSPFLDQKIWEFAARLPFSLRLRGGELKAVLRELVRRRVGEEVASRPKRGFTVPVERWIVTRWKDSLEELAHAPALEREGWIAPGRTAEAVREALQGGQAPVQLWRLLVLERWLRRQ